MRLRTAFDGPWLDTVWAMPDTEPGDTIVLRLGVPGERCGIGHAGQRHAPLTAANAATKLSSRGSFSCVSALGP